MMEYTWITWQIEVLEEQRAKMHQEITVHSTNVNRSICDEVALVQLAGTQEVVGDR